MSTYKRRIVYLSDEEWAGLASTAKERGTTISSLIRGRLVKTLGPNPDGLWAAGGLNALVDTPKSAQTKRDDLLRKINRS